MTKKVLILIATIILISIVIFLIFKKPKDTENYFRQGSTIVAFGDSLVQGVGATKDNDFVKVLEGMIKQPIINMGVSGNTTAQGLKRLDEVIEKNPKIVLVLLGGNDFLRKVPIEETFANLETIISRLQENETTVVLLGIRGGLLNDPYKEKFEKLAKEKNVSYVPDVLSGLLGKKQYMSDAIHPNDLGYKKIAEKIYPVMRMLTEQK